MIDTVTIDQECSTYCADVIEGMIGVLLHETGTLKDFAEVGEVKREINKLIRYKKQLRPEVSE